MVGRSDGGTCVQERFFPENVTFFFHFTLIDASVHCVFMDG